MIGTEALLTKNRTAKTDEKILASADLLLILRFNLATENTTQANPNQRILCTTGKTITAVAIIAAHFFDFFGRIPVLP